MNKTEVINTAYIIIYYKAVDYDLQGKRFSDPIARKLVVEPAIEAGEKLKSVFPPILPWIKMRDKYFDDQIENAYKNGIKQVLILGAGLDVRPFRHKNKDIRFFEVDFSSTIEFKKEKFKEAKLETNSQFINGNYLEINLKNKLIEKNCQLDEPILIIWEGNLFYQTEENIKKLIDNLKNIFKHFILTFDYIPKAIINKETGKESMDKGLDIWFKVGSKFTYSLESAKEFAEKYDFEVNNDLKCNQMMEKVIGRKLPELNTPLYTLYGFGSLSYNINKIKNITKQIIYN